MIVVDQKRNEVTFIYQPEEKPKAVYLAGTFNEWDPSKIRMVKTRDGSYRKRMKLPSGEYEYKFVVDGVWIDDPDVEKVGNTFGTTNSVAKVL